MRTDDVLSRMGLQARMTPVDYLLPALGIFGAGLVVGAGLGMLFSPRRGSEMRESIARRARSARRRIGEEVEARRSGDLESMSHEALYELASEHDIEGRASMNRQQLIAALSERESH